MAPRARPRPPLLAALVAFGGLVALPGCASSGGGRGDEVDSSPLDSAKGDSVSDAADLGPIEDAAPFPPRRLPCLPASALARDLPGDAFGALEAEIVSLVPPGTAGCPEDGDHLHLQVVVDAKRYDIAITIASVDGSPMALLAKDVAPALPAMGFSGAGFDLAKDLGVPSADYTSLPKAALLARLKTELASAARVSIHGRAYADGTGVHNVHRNGGGRDGVVLVRRGGAAGQDHAIAIRFAADAF